MKHLLILLLTLSFSDNCRSDNTADKSPTGEIIATSIIRKIPILTGGDINESILLNIALLSEPPNPLSVTAIQLEFSNTSAYLNIRSVIAIRKDTSNSNLKNEPFGDVANPGRKPRINGKSSLNSGSNEFSISLIPSDSIDYLSFLKIEGIKLTLSDGYELPVEIKEGECTIRFGNVLRASGQDGCDTYRIPGLVRTNSGTLIAVYDNRYLNSADLQGDIDIGMSRSTDGGNTWEPMKVIMDMAKWGGKPEAENGVGDPCVLVDKITGTIWVAGLWIHGFPDQRAWTVSGQGNDPSETGQFMLVNSVDDGISWSDPINITVQLKNPEWKLLLQGPGNGISISDGIIVFPAQYKDAIGLPFSTIVWSSDHGSTWHIGTGAKENTTEAQCVELADGSIMLNMRDNRNGTIKDHNNGRAVSVTSDLGKTWNTHPSSNSALPEPVCMASLISADVRIMGLRQRVLFFSNPANKTSRSNMTIKASLDEGLTWPTNYHLEINEESGFGYSCMTMIDPETIGILYEGNKNLIFQKISIWEVLKAYNGL